MFRTALFAAALVCLSSIPRTADAQWGFYPGFGPYGGFCGGGFGGGGFGGGGWGGGGFGNCGFGGGNGGAGGLHGGVPFGLFGANWLAGTTYLRPQFPPYYAVNPPVYYSHMITARHYGASPHAWWPGMQPITYVGRGELRSPPQPQFIENPFVRKAQQARAAEQENPAAVVALAIDNPYLVSAQSSPK